MSWRLEPAEGPRRVALTWRESGGPPVRPPSRRGLGSDLLERGLPADAAVRLRFDPAGLVRTMRLPLEPDPA